MLHTQLVVGSLPLNSSTLLSLLQALNSLLCLCLCCSADKVPSKREI